MGGIKYWAQVFYIPVYLLSCLVPRNKNLWLFGSTFGRRFADNPRYFYLYLSQHKELGIRPVWISHKKEIVNSLNQAGYEAYYYKSLKGIWYCLRGKVYLYDNYSKDISFCLSGRAVKVNLWHGIPLKKIQMDNIFDRVRHPKNGWEKFRYALRRMSDEKPSHYVLTTSSEFAPIFSSAFATKKVLICSGYPRCDIFTSKEINNLLSEKENKYFDIIDRQKEKKIILYMPTFRDSETKFFDIMNLKKFNLFLEKHNFLFCTKLHCKSKLRREFEKMESDNIVVIDPDTDPYVYIELSDMLVTDYSSIYFDYLLTEKPMLFFCYDLEEYLSKSRELYFDYEEVTPGKKVRTMQEFEEALLDWENMKKEAFQDGFRKRIRKKAFGKKKQGTASYRLYKAICEQIKRI